MQFEKGPEVVYGTALCKFIQNAQTAVHLFDLHLLAHYLVIT